MSKKKTKSRRLTLNEAKLEGVMEVASGVIRKNLMQRCLSPRQRLPFEEVFNEAVRECLEKYRALSRKDIMSEIAERFGSDLETILNEDGMPAIEEE